MAVRDDLVNLTISANEDSLAYPPQLDAKLAYLAMDVGTADSAPTEAEQKEFEKLKRQSGELIGALGRLAAARSGGVPEADGGRKLVDGGGAAGGAVGR